MLNDVEPWRGQTVSTLSTFDSTKIHKRPGIQSQALGFTRASSYNVERGGQTASTSHNIRDNKRNVEQVLKQSLNAFILIQHRFNFDSTSFNTVSRGWQTVSTLLFNKIEWMLKQMLKPFARGLRWLTTVFWGERNLRKTLAGVFLEIFFYYNTYNRDNFESEIKF